VALSTAEGESLRFHLGYGNVGVGAYPYTPDGFKELFEQVIAPNLTGDTETTATTAVTAGRNATVTPVSMTGITVNARLVVDVGDDAEIVVVKAVTATTFSAKFALAHPASGYPVALLGGQARLRLLLHRADQAWEALQNGDIGETTGLKKVDEVEFYQGMWLERGKLAQYRIIVGQLSSLTRVQPVGGCGGSQSLEAY
jgi:hypothetical protein